MKYFGGHNPETLLVPRHSRETKRGRVGHLCLNDIETSAGVTSPLSKKSLLTECIRLASRRGAGVMEQLETTWSTRQVPPTEALSYWKDVICKNLLELNIDSSFPASFAGQIAKHAFGPLNANFISVTEQRVWRTRHLDCRGGDERQDANGHHCEG